MQNRKLSISNSQTFDIKYNITKNLIPVCFIDTSIFIFLAKEENKSIYNELLKLVEDNKIIIFSLNHMQEFIRKNRENSKIIKIYLSLVNGWYIDKIKVKDSQLMEYSRVLSKHINLDIDNFVSLVKEEEFNLNCKDVLFQNHEMVNINELMQLTLINNKEKRNNELKKIADNKLKFDKYLSNELFVEINKFREHLLNNDEEINYLINKDILKIKDRFLQKIIIEANKYIFMYNSVKNRNEHANMLGRYLMMKGFFTPPEKYIFSRLYAFILTSSKISSGDYMDIEFMSSSLPYCDYYFTDKKMVNIAKELKIDKKFEVELLREKDLKKFISSIKKDTQ